MFSLVHVLMIQSSGKMTTFEHIRAIRTTNPFTNERSMNPIVALTRCMNFVMNVTQNQKKYSPLKSHLGLSSVAPNWFSRHIHYSDVTLFSKKPVSRLKVNMN